MFFCEGKLRTCEFAGIGIDEYIVLSFFLPLADNSFPYIVLRPNGSTSFLTEATFLLNHAYVQCQKTPLIRYENRKCRNREDALGQLIFSFLV